jgi:hypothetical protein
MVGNMVGVGGPTIRSGCLPITANTVSTIHKLPTLQNGRYKYDLAYTSLGYSLGHEVTFPPAIYIVSPDMLF